MALFLGLSAHAQKEISFGVKAGVNFSDVSGIPSAIGKGRISYHFGGVVNVGLTERLSIQPEAHFSRQGFKQEGIEIRLADGGSVAFDLNSNLDYINIPVLLSYEAAEGLNLQGGPQFGIGIDSSSTVANVIQGSEDDIPDSFFGPGLDLNSPEVGFAAGIEYFFGEHFFAQARYIIGFTEVFDGGKDRKNRNGQVSVGYRF